MRERLRSDRDDRGAQRTNRSLDATPELLPFLPELLADVWALGGSVEIIVDLLRPMGLDDPGRRVFDVGCGKGAIAVSLAKQIGCRVYGVDGFEPFIAEARSRATDAGVAELCTFECGDRGKLGTVTVFCFDE